MASVAEIFGQRPDFLLATMTPLCLLATSRGSVVIGFVAGVFQGGIAGANLAHYAISRTLASWGLALFRGLELDIGLGMAAVATALATLFSQLVLMLLAPPPALPPFLAATIGTAVYNGVIAMPIYALLRKLVPAKPGV